MHSLLLCKLLWMLTGTSAQRLPQLLLRLLPLLAQIGCMMGSARLSYSPASSVPRPLVVRYPRLLLLMVPC
jgi:hypothetical protein